MVDDGSGSESAEIFARAAAFPGVHLLRHASNQGKGAAVKTAFRFAQQQFPDMVGVVTADADGQHDPKDIARVAAVLLAHDGQNLVLGARAFQGTVPLRSRIGNIITSRVMHVLLGRKLRDTQTGLRGIPASLLPRLLELESNGYEFELEMLILAHQFSVPIIEEPIRTIYEAGNRSSHFNPLVDSMKIYFVLARFASVSLLTALLDNLVFYIAYRRTGEVLASQVVGRLLAVAFNYWMVRRSVFFSRERHLSTLPKYLALVVISGAASYGGIRALGATLGIPPVAAKLMVESALFFANFAVQRLLIFRPSQVEQRRPVGAVSVALYALLAACVAVEAYGFGTSHLFAQHIWNPAGLDRFLRYGRLFVLFSVPVLWWAPRYYVPAVSTIALIGTFLAAGPWAPAAVALFLLAAMAVGSRVVEDQLLALLAGAGIFILLMLAVSRLPVNTPAAWAAILLVPLLLDWRGFAKRLQVWIAAARTQSTGTAVERAALAILVFLVGAHWLVTLTPEQSADGLAMHLAIATDMARHHAFTFQPGRTLWAVMPMGADWAYAITYLLGGEFASRLVNFAMLLVLLGLLYAAARRWLGRATALLLTALFAASPLVQLVTGSLFVENLLAAMLLGMLTAIWRFGDTGKGSYLYTAAFLGGIALNTKLAALPFVLLAIPFAVWEMRGHWKMVGGRRCTAVAALLLVSALPTYVLAWVRTGNPVYPFLNPTIHSPLLNPAVEIRDYRFRQPLSRHTPFDLTFRTHLYYEGQNGSLGFQYLLLAPAALIALAVARRREAAGAAIIGVTAILLVLRSEPNTRYLYAALPLLTISFAALVGWARKNDGLLHAALIASAAVCILLDVWFLPASGWYHKNFYAHYEFRRDGYARFIDEDAPARFVVNAYNHAHPNSTMLLVDDTDLADAQGNVLENHWHQYDTWEKIQNAVNLPQMMQLANTWKLEYLIGRLGAEEPAGLREYLAQCTDKELEHGGIYLAKVEPTCAEIADAPPVTAGAYDDFDPFLRFHGDWLHGAEFPAAFHRSVSYTDTRGAEATLLFEGRGITYVFTRAPNRGRAEVLVDGISKGVVDLYAPQAEWQSRFRVCCLDAGRHTVAIRVLGDSRKEATGKFVDVDELVVE